MAISEQDGFIYIDGKKDIGYLDLKGYRESAPIRLEVGNKGYGLTHIELRHGDEIRNAGFESVEHFIKHVADNYTEVRKAKDGKLLLDVVDGRSGKAMLVQLQPEGDGSYWGISTAGIFNKRYINSFDKVVDVDRTSQQQVRDDAARFRTASSLQVPSLGEGAPVTTSQNTTTTNLTKQAATDIVSKNSSGKRLLNNGKVQVLDSIDEAPAHVLEQAKRSEVASYDDYAVLANVFLGYAESDGATQFASSSSTNIAEITKAVGKGVLSVVDNGDVVHFYKGGKKVASLLDNFDGTVEINTAALSADGSGKMIMHIALEYAFNNGLRLKPNGGLTTINTYRFTESMLSSALRHGTTKHLIPDVAAQRLTGWSSANDNEKILLLLQRSYENTIKNTPSLSGATYDLRASAFMDNSGTVLTDEKIIESFRDDDAARKAGIGMATFKKAIVARSILEALQDGRAVAQPLVDEEYGLAKINGLLYSQNGNIQGFYDPTTETTYLVADALTADTIDGVLLHEVGVHAWWAKANSEKKTALEKRAMQLLNQGKRFGNDKIKAFYAGVEQRMIDANVQGNAEEAAAYIVEEAINQAGADKSKLSDSRIIDWVAKNISQSLANFLSDFISSVRASMQGIGWLDTDKLTGADLVAIAKRNMREVATLKGVENTHDNVGVEFSKGSKTTPASTGLIAPEWSTSDKFIESEVDDMDRLEQMQNMVRDLTGDTSVAVYDAARLRHGRT